MKCAVLLADGMADRPLGQLGGQTPLEFAHTPNMDYIAEEGACGMLRTIPFGFEAGSDIANLSILGYDPRIYYTGRGPLEAASLAVDLGDNDVAYRCNLVTIESGLMHDFSAGHIPSGEGAALIHAIDGLVPGVHLYPGVSYRNLLVVPGGAGAATTPPHDIVGKPVAEHLPRGGDAPLLHRTMEMCGHILAGHPINEARARAGHAPGNAIWPWSGGRKPALPLFRKKFGIDGGMIAAVDLLNGIARYAGMEVIHVPGATGFLDTDYHAKGKYALAALERLDFMYVHVEAIDEAGHMGSIDEKVRAIERFDEMVGIVLDGFDGIIAVLPDHPTPIVEKTHTNDPVPFAVLGKGKDACTRFSEKEAAKGVFGLLEGCSFLPLLLQ
ncbi:MAG: cofactor-independent phosphoglycerate mutase [Methanomicrobiales archaeon]|nr:cofactor-independent phosphoglycerate mutase [Methanomicrobiales archaeon]